MRCLILRTTQNTKSNASRNPLEGWASDYQLDQVDSLLELGRQMNQGHYNLLFLELSPDDSIDHQTVESIRQAHPEIPLVVLGNNLPADAAAKVLRTGADEFFSDNLHPEEMEARIEALLRRSKSTTSHKIQCGPLRYSPSEKMAWLNEAPISLSPRETLILQALMTTPSTPISKEKLMQQLFGSYTTENANAVEVYVHRLRRKLQHPGIRIRTLRSNGYMLEWDPTSLPRQDNAQA